MSVAPYVPGLPGVRSVKAATHRTVFKQASEMFLAGGRVIDGTLSRDPGNTGDLTTLRPGLLMGRVTTTGRYAPSILGVTLNAESSGSTSIEVSVATATELVRRIGASGTFKLVGPPTSGGTVATATVTYSAVNLTTGAITVTALSSAFIAGSFVCPTDGSETPLTFIPDGYGITVAEMDGTIINEQFAELPIGGSVESSKLLPVFPSDTSLRNWLVSNLNAAAGGQFVFDHRY